MATKIYRSILIIVAFLSMTCLATACGPSTETLLSTPFTPVASAPVSLPVEIPLSQYIRFEGLTVKDGLSNNEVWGIVQDNYGFMWFATLDGLNRYDGVDFKIYRHNPDDLNSLSQSSFREMIVDQYGTLWFGLFNGGLNQYDHAKDHFIRYEHDPEDPLSLSNDSVRALFEDRAGTIWVGTLDGLNKLDRETGQFTHYRHDPDNPASLSHDTVFSIFEDSRGILWIGTGDGLDHFNPNTETFHHYRNDPDNPQSLSHNIVRAIIEDESGNLWVATQMGLNRFNPETEQFVRYLYDAIDPQSLSENYILTINVDLAGNLWVGTFGGGINRYDPETDSFIRYQSDVADPYSLGGDSVYRIFEDPTGRLWMGTDDGISLLDGGAKPFRHFRTIPDIPNSLSHNVVRSLYVNDDGIVWVGTSGGGLNRFDPQTEQFTHYQHDPDDPDSLTINRVWALTQDREGLVWLSAGPGKLDSFDPETGQFTHYIHDPSDPNSISNSGTNYLLDGHDGTLWIGTWGGGLNAFDRETGSFTRYINDPDDPQSLGHDQVSTLLEDHTGMLWVGTNQGLNRFDPQKEIFTRYPYLDHASITAMSEDHDGIIWIGTTDGLHKLDQASGQFNHYNRNSGLPSEWIYGILVQERSPGMTNGYLWLSTPNGLSRFDPLKETFRNYDVSDGLQSNSFLGYSAYAQSPNGDMYFGGTDGFNAFDPDQISDNPLPPPVEITNFQLENKLVSISAVSVLQQSILETNKLELSYDNRVFSFEFAALNFRAPQKNRYKYKLEGFDDDWIETDSARRFATYTNLDPGDYVFHVIASNNDGVWNEAGDSIAITITPPWWETDWFWISILVLAIGLVVGAYRARVRSIEARSRELETQVVERTHELEGASQAALESKQAAEAANQAKSRFLANMSHELRTPLNAILGFSRMLSRDSGISARQNEMLEIINRSGKHLLGMVDDVLSLSAIEAGGIELKEEVFNLIEILGDIGLMFKSRAEGKGLFFHMDLDVDIHPWLQADSGKLRQVLINLLGNAVKYTQRGDIWLRAGTQPIPDEPAKVSLQVEVQDTGPGIPADQINQIFETFVRYGSEQSTVEGTGLGLSISKALVEMMGGQISLESELGQGSLFKFHIPLRTAGEEEAVSDETLAPQVIGLQDDGMDWRILVADDHYENRLLLSNLLAQIGFTVQQVENGQEAIEQFQNWQPHFIWMDIRMPVMDGCQATKAIRSMPDGKSVKIVAITASVLAEQREEILAAGCDDLVRKPFRDHEIFETMAVQLGVRYLYEEDKAETAHRQGIQLTSRMLAELPPELLQELDQTTLALDTAATLAIVERIGEQAPDTAAVLYELVHNLEMGRIREILKETA